MKGKLLPKSRTRPRLPYLQTASVRVTDKQRFPPSDLSAEQWAHEGVCRSRDHERGLPTILALVKFDYVPGLPEPVQDPWVAGEYARQKSTTKSCQLMEIAKRHINFDR